MLRKTLDLPTLRDLARDAKVSYHAIRQYRKGQRTPPPAVLARLAEALQRHSVHVAGTALHLRQLASSEAVRLTLAARDRPRARRTP